MFSRIGLVFLSIIIFLKPKKMPSISPLLIPNVAFPTPLVMYVAALSGTVIKLAAAFSNPPPLFTRLMLLNRILLIRFLLYLLPFIFL